MDTLNDIGIYNLGGGKGVSVLEIMKAVEKASDKKGNYVIGNRREGDLPEFYLGHGKGISVLEIIKDFEKTSGKK